MTKQEFKTEVVEDLKWQRNRKKRLPRSNESWYMSPLWYPCSDKKKRAAIEELISEGKINRLSVTETWSVLELAE
jgi:hypothetical protein